MKTKFSPAAIGIFISGAVVILFISLVVLGSGQLFQQSRVYLLTFREPVKGLQVGSPVKLLGVDVGDVKAISIALDPSEVGAYRVNVFVEINQKRTQLAFKEETIDLDDRAQFDEDIRKTGVRGQLDTQNLLSGQLYIALILAPDQEGFQLKQEDEHGYWEIPTLTSTKRQMVDSLAATLETVAELDLKGALAQLNGLLTDLRSVMDQMELSTVGERIDETLLSANNLLSNPELVTAITNLNQTLAQMRELTTKVNAKADPLLAHAESDLKKFGETLDESKAALADLRAQVAPASPLSRELVLTLDSAEETLTSLRQLIEQLKRNPNSILTGKKPNNP